MQRDSLALTLVVMQAVVRIIGLTIIGLHNIAISKMALQLGALIAKTHERDGAPRGGAPTRRL